MNNNYFPVGHKLPYPSTLKIIQEAYKQYDEKLLSENLEIIQTRELSNTSSDESWVLASNAANELSKPDGPKVAVFEVDDLILMQRKGGLMELMQIASQIMIILLDRLNHQ